MDSVVDLLETFSKKGAKFWTSNGRLHYKAPKGALSEQEIGELKRHREKIIFFLEKTVNTEVIGPGVEAHAPTNYRPLTYTQLARWKLHKLRSRPSRQFIALALHIRGPLDIDALRKSVAEVVRRHDALRTRITMIDEIPVQEVDPPSSVEMRIEDLTGWNKSVGCIEVNRQIAKYALEPVDLAVGPLFRARLLMIGQGEQVLILSMDHIISDGFSAKILLNELITAYTQILDGREISLPVIPMQLADYADFQRRTPESWWQTRLAYWDKRLKGCGRVGFPSDKMPTIDTQSGWGTVSFHLNMDLTAELRNWSRANRTTVVMTVFAAYVALVLRWCNASEAVFLYQIDGRVSETMQNVIGYFAFPLYLRLGCFPDDNFIDLLNRVIDEYCLAYDHAEFSYIEAQGSLPEFARNTMFNWVGGGFQSERIDSRPGGLTVSRIPIEARVAVDTIEIDVEPGISIYGIEDGIHGEVYFPHSRFSVGTIARFTRNIPNFVETLLRNPDMPVSDVRLS